MAYLDHGFQGNRRHLLPDLNLVPVSADTQSCCLLLFLLFVLLKVVLALAWLHYRYRVTVPIVTPTTKEVESK